MGSQPRPERGLSTLLIGFLLAATCSAQGLDDRIGRAVYDLDGAGVRALMGAVDRTAYPVFYGSVPAAWLMCGVADRCDARDAGRVTLAMAGSYGISIGMKRLFRRHRPGRAFRTEFVGARGLEDSFAMPSGHSALAAAVAVSVAGGDPTARAVLLGWAGLVGVSRVWLGVHHPSDVLAGWAVGVSMALLAAVVLPSDHTQGPTLRIVVR